MFLFCLALAVIGAFVYYKFLRKVYPEPKYLGRTPQKKTAVVIGGGIGGICAAKVLSGFFQKVIVLDRDTIDLEAPVIRSGVPQCSQLHALLARGCATADTLFPGIWEEWVANGADEVDMIKDFKMEMNGITLSEVERAKEGPTFYALAMSRAFNEFHLRRRLLKDCPNVELLTKTTVLGLLYEKDTNKVTGVKIKRRQVKQQEEDKEEKQKTETIKEDLIADFVVGSAGRKNQLKKWLQEIKVIEEGEEIPHDMCFPGLGYSTSRWRPPAGWYEKNNVPKQPVRIVLGSPTAFPWSVFYYEIDNKDFGVCVMSYGKNYPPTNTEEIKKIIEPILEKDKSKSGILLNIFNEWEQIIDWTPYHDERNIFHHYHKLGSRWPNNFVAIGDTVATFNPSFGQGMTQAIMHAQTLKDSLNKHVWEYPLHDLTGLSQRIQDAAAQVSTNFWSGVEPNDLQWPTTEGTRTKGKDFFAYFQSHLWRIACSDRVKNFQFGLVINGILDPPQVFFSPQFLFPALKNMAIDAWEQYQKKSKEKKEN